MLYGRLKPFDLIFQVIFADEVFINNVNPFLADQVCLANTDTRRDIDTVQV
jgi:hypothetical protein